MFVPTDKFEIIEDVFGESFYVKEVLYDAKFKLKVYSGRPIGKMRGRNRFILTPELKAFILSTLDMHLGEFTDLLKKAKTTQFRRLVQDNPFKSYERWVTSKRKDKPSYITFNDARSNPQILTDIFGCRYVLMSASRTKEGLIFPMGALEELFLDKKIKNSKKYIITPEVAKVLEKTHSSLLEGVKYLPVSTGGMRSLHAELGYQVSDVHEERNLIYVQHFDELINSTAKAFFLSHPELDTSEKMVGDMKLHIAFVQKEAKNPKSLLIAALAEHWDKPNSETVKKVDKAFGRKTPKIRRAFLILKRAKRL